MTDIGVFWIENFIRSIYFFKPKTVYALLLQSYARRKKYWKINIGISRDYCSLATIPIIKYPPAKANHSEQ